MKNKIKKYVKLRKKVSHKSRLLNAWSKVYSNGITSSSYETRKGVEEFSKEVNRNLGHIETQLKKGTFRFLNSRGVAISREGKDPRPLVISPIQNRIVQRSILEILQSDKKLKTYFEVPTSFGGLKKKSVSDAIAFIHEKMKSGAVYFVRSDIKSFFTNIPKELVISLIRDNLSVKDDDFIKLLREAVTVELENLDKLTEVKDLFPLHEEGVAQGSCLSPLFGNIFLREFDEKTNSEDVFCVRFIDDFVILGSSEKAVKAKYKAGVKYLEKYNLELYDPFNSNDDKAVKVLIF